MTKRLLKRSLEYQSRVRLYAENLADRYRVEVADAFLDRIEAAEKFLCDNNLAGTDSPYLLAGQQVVLKELYIDSGPVRYCLIYEVNEEYVGLISLWHGVGSRIGYTGKAVGNESIEMFHRLRSLSSALVQKKTLKTAR